MTEETRVSLLEANMTEIKAAMSDIKTDIKSLSNQLDNLLNTKVVDHVQIRAEIETMQKEISQLQRTGNFWKWFSPTLAAAFSAIFTLLVVNYINNLK